MNLMDIINKHNLRTIVIEEETAKLSDEVALTVVNLFQEWRADNTYNLGERRCYNGKLYRCVQAHTSQSEWTPDQTPALWTEVALPGEIPVWKQPTGAQDAYMTGDKVHYPDADGAVYESLIDNNVYSPEAYPAGWAVVE